MNWGNVTLLWKHILANLVASSVDASYPVSNILLRREGSWYLAGGTTTPIYIYPASGPGGGSALTADFLFISGHNLATIGATVTLQHSTTGAWAGEEVNIATYAPTNDKTFALLFTSASKDYWRLRFAGTLSAAPQIAICYWGERAEIGLCVSSFDPNKRTTKSNIKKTQGGVISGIHKKYRERGSITYNFGKIDADGAEYTDLDEWDLNIGQAPFGVIWEPINHSTEVYLLHDKEGNFDMPLVDGGLYRMAKLNLTGRMEE